VTDTGDANGKAAKADVRFSQGRSPAYPYIDLQKAVERAQQVRAAGAARQAMPPETFYQIWKIGPQSSGARQTMAALNHFGLATYQSRGDSRKVKLSDLALKIVLDTQPISAERDAAVKEAALSPGVHRELFDKYGPILPADFVIHTYLVRDRGYNEQAAKSLISEYKDTLAFAGLNKPDNMPEAKDEFVDEHPLQPAKAGDFVQWTSGGVDQFDSPRRVVAVSDDGLWLWVEGSQTGIAMSQISVTSGEPAGAAQPPPPPPAVAAALVAAAAAANAAKLDSEEEDSPGLKEEKFGVDEGVVKIKYPEIMSVASVDELEEFFALFIKKAKRRAKPN
jgi:hypothetical protein